MEMSHKGIVNFWYPNIWLCQLCLKIVYAHSQFTAFDKDSTIIIRKWSWGSTRVITCCTVPNHPKSIQHRTRKKGTIAIGPCVYLLRWSMLHNFWTKICNVLPWCQSYNFTAFHILKTDLDSNVYALQEVSSSPMPCLSRGFLYKDGKWDPSPPDAAHPWSHGPSDRRWDPRA